jgi:hypothetical protein
MRPVVLDFLIIISTVALVTVPAVAFPRPVVFLGLAAITVLLSVTLLRRLHIDDRMEEGADLLFDEDPRSE